MSISSSLLLFLGALIADASAFAPVNVPSLPLSSSSSLKHRPLTTTVLHTTLAAGDWHASLLHPLDDFGVDDAGSLVANSGSPRVGWDSAFNARVSVASERSDDSGTMAELAGAFLPVALLIGLEIAYDANNMMCT